MTAPRGHLYGLLVASAVAFGATGCQGAGQPTFAGTLSLSVEGQGVTSSVPNPCEVDVDFGTVPLGQQATATIEIANRGDRVVSFQPLTLDLDPELSVNAGGLQAPLAAGATAQLSVSFNPVRTAAVMSTLSIPFSTAGGAQGSICGSGNSAITVNLSGSGVPVKLVVAPASLYFGAVLINETSTKTVTLTNQSTLRVRGLSAVVTGTDEALFTVANAATALAPGASTTVSISYAPLAVETRSVGTVTFAGTEGASASLSLSGEPVANALALNPIDFGFVPLGTTVVGCTTVSNRANLTIDITGISAFDSVDGAFAVVSMPKAIMGGGSAEVCFSLTPPTTQDYDGSATLDTDDPSGNNPIIQLMGFGGGPQIDCAPTSLDFGQVAAYTSSTKTIQCTNVGSPLPGVDADLIIPPPLTTAQVFQVTFDAGQTIIANPLVVLTPGQTAQYDVTYLPTMASIDEASVLVRSNGGQEGAAALDPYFGQPLQIPVSGQGLSLQPCQFQISPQAIDFGGVPAGDVSTTMPLEIQNTGNSVCVVQNVTFEHDPAASFNISSMSLDWDLSALGHVIVLGPAGGSSPSSLTLMLDFGPKSAGGYTASAVIAIAAPAAPIPTISLSGTGD